MEYFLCSKNNILCIENIVSIYLSFIVSVNFSIRLKLGSGRALIAEECVYVSSSMPERAV